MRAALLLLLPAIACGGGGTRPASPPAAAAPGPVAVQPVQPAPPVPAPEPDTPVASFAVELGTHTQRGDMDAALIASYVARHQEAMLRCYEVELATNLDLAGSMTATFKITADGSVYSANAYGVDDDLADCVVQILSAIQFPPTKGGGIVEVSYPISFGRSK